MLRKVLLAAAVSGIAVTTALAQSSAPTTSPSAPAVTQPAPSTQRAPTATAPATTPSADKAATAPTTSADKAMFVTKQSADQHLASKFKGTDVLGAADEKIGDVSDILFDDKGTVLAYIVGVGGFLGIGAKDVAIAPASFQKVPGKDGSTDEKLRLSMTKEQLKQAAAFEPYTPPRPAASATPRPTSPSPMAPAPSSAPKKE